MAGVRCRPPAAAPFRLNSAATLPCHSTLPRRRRRCRSCAAARARRRWTGASTWRAAAWRTRSLTRWRSSIPSSTPGCRVRPAALDSPDWAGLGLGLERGCLLPPPPVCHSEGARARLGHPASLAACPCARARARATLQPALTRSPAPADLQAPSCAPSASPRPRACWAARSTPQAATMEHICR